MKKAKAETENKSKSKVERYKLQKRQKKQIAFLTAVALIASMIAIMLLTPAFDIKNIEIDIQLKAKGSGALTVEDVRRASGIVKGVNIFSVSLSAAEDNISSLGYIEKVEIERDLPSTIKITVVEGVGVAYLTSKEGYVIITEGGKCIDVTDGISKNSDTNAASLPKLPVIKGIKNVKYKEGEIIKSDDSLRIEALFACLHEFAKYGYIFDMKEIDMTDLNDIRFYYKGKDLCVSVGDTEKIGYKMECFGPIYDELVEMRDEGEKIVGFVDLERLTYRETIESPVKIEDTEEDDGEKTE